MSEPPDDGEMGWAAFLLMHSNDIRSHARLFERVIFGKNLADDDEGGREQPPRPAVRQKD